MHPTPAKLAPALCMAVAASVYGQPPATPPADTGPAEAPPGYGGAISDRGFLSGNWDGARDNLAENGLTFDLGWTQFVQGVVSGGRRRDWDYGGNLDALLTADLEKMSPRLGGVLSVRAESRYGETVNDDSGAFTPVNTRGYFPLASSVNQGVPLAITELTYGLSLTESLEVTFGKMITCDGDPTEFAGGRGRTQFFNSNFIYNAATSQTAPYSTLGAAVDWSAAHWITLSSALFATTDSSTTTGFDHLNEGWTWWSQAATQYRLGTLPGGMNAGFQYAFGNEFTKIGGRLTLIPGGAALETVSHSWAVFWGAWQYLYTPDTAPDEIDAGDGKADLRGVGLFARVGFADPDANPVNWSASIGLGGRALIPGRDHDTWGAGYYYTDVQNTRAFALLNLPTSTQGFEAYYNLALTPAVAVTLDVQWIDEGLQNLDPATVVGLRLDVAF